MLHAVLFVGGSGKKKKKVHIVVPPCDSIQQQYRANASDFATSLPPPL